MTRDYFGEDVAEHYDETSADMFEPAVLDPAVDFLAGFVGDGAALEFGIGERHRPVEPKPPAPRLVSPSSATS